QSEAEPVFRPIGGDDLDLVVGSGILVRGLHGDPLAGFREVAVAIAVHVENFSIEDEPDARLRLWTQYEQAVFRLRFVGRLLLQAPVDLRKVGGVCGGCPPQRARGQYEERDSHEHALLQGYRGIAHVASTAAPSLTRTTRRFTVSAT